MPKLTMLSAPAASGKSTLARKMLQEDPNAIRLNRDDIRKMSIAKWTPSREGWIIAAEQRMAEVAIGMGKNVIIDDTNLMPQDEDRWKGNAKCWEAEFHKVKLDTSLEVCVERDSKRKVGHVGRHVIERQFLRAGLWKIPDGMDVWLFDIDGTLADLSHRVAFITPGATCSMCEGEGRFKYSVEDVDYSTNPATIIYEYKECSGCAGAGKITKKNHDMFYSLVLQDKPIEIVVKWIQTVYNEVDETGKRKNHVIIVSGRSPEKCGDDTIMWLSHHNIPYDHIIMRRPNMHGPDDEEKQLILDDILKIIPKERIAFVVDDRPSVIAMWKKNGLRVIPVRGSDDDMFYTALTEAEKTWPREEFVDNMHKLSEAVQNLAGKMREQILSPSTAPKRSKKTTYKRPLSTYFRQGIVRLSRWWTRL